MIAGRFKRPIAIKQPGMFLSQPGSAMSPSYHCAPMTVSIESAMISRDGNEYDMPSVPMEMPSDTPMVLKRMPTSPAAVTPSFTCAARSFRCMLQVLPSPVGDDADLGFVHVRAREAGTVKHGLRGALRLGLR